MQYQKGNIAIYLILLLNAIILHIIKKIILYLNNFHKFFLVK